MYQEILRGFSGDVNSLLRKFHWQRSYVLLGEVSCEVQKFVENSRFGCHFSICLLKELRIRVLRGKQLDYTLLG